ncbi:MAG: flippase [Anaerolineae bacterium]|nr:flippase [Anaerolineae bacterium]
MAQSTTEVRRIGRNLSFTFIGRLVLYGLSAAWTVYLAPALGDEAFGMYSIVRAFVALFALVPDMGIGLVVIRDIAADHSKTRAYLLNSLVAKIALAVLAFAALALLSRLIYPDIPSYMFALVGFGLLAQAVGMVPVQGLQALEQMGAAAAVELISHLTFIGGGFALMLAGFGLDGVLWALALGGVAALVAGGAVMLVKFKPDIRNADLAQTRYLLREGFPLGLGSALGLVYLQADKLILGKMMGEAAVGWYNAAYVLYYTLIEIINTPVIVGSYPTLARYYRSDPAALEKLLERLVYGMMLIALPLALGGTLMARPVIAFLYGDAYPESPPALAVLLWSLVLIFPGTLLVQMLIVEGRQDRVLRLRALSAILAVALNVAMIAAFGYAGPAAAIFMVQLAVNGVAVWWMRARLPALRLGAYLFRAALALAPMAAVCLIVGPALHLPIDAGARTWDLGAPLTIVLAAGVYGTALVALGAVRREDWEYVRGMVGR